jgi:glycosyltransferase involved in cell wall biosynthesis
MAKRATMTKRLVLGVVDAGLEAKSGGVYSLMEGMLRSAGDRPDVIVKVFGTSEDIRKNAYGPNVVVSPLHQRSDLLKRCSRALRALPLVAPRMTSSRLFSAAELKLASWASEVSPADVTRWIYPHCFSPVPNLDNLIVICHDLQHYTYPEYFSWPVRQMRQAAEGSLSNAKRIICVSNFTRNELLGRRPELESRTSVIHEPHDIELDDAAIARELNEVERSLRDPYFLYPALDWPHKNHALLLRAAGMLKREVGPGFRIVLTGQRRRGGWLRAQIVEQGVSEVVLDWGPISFARLVALYKRARALVFPSLFEGFGRPIVESMACGTPVVASRSTAIPEIVGDGGLLFDPSSAAELVNAVKEMLFDDALRVALSSAALRRSKRFTWARWWEGLSARVE